MALPFIVGLHQCSLTHGPDGRPQVEVVLRIRLPLAEFFDALLLSLADQRPLFQQSGYGTAQASPVPVKAGLQTGGHIGPMPKEDAPPYWKATSRAQPKRPSHPPKHAPKVDPTHEKLLAVLSQSASISDTAAVGAAATANDLPTPSIDEGSMMSTTQPGKSQSNRQAFGKVLAGHILPAGQESVLYWLGAGSWRLQTLPTVLGGGGQEQVVAQAMVGLVVQGGLGLQGLAAKCAFAKRGRKPRLPPVLGAWLALVRLHSREGGGILFVGGYGGPLLVVGHSVHVK